MLEIDAAQKLGSADVEITLATPTDGVLALFGPSGAGKTTVLNWLAGLGRPDRGRIRLNGTTLFDRAAGINLPPEKRRVAYMFQDLRLFPHLNVRDNIRYGWRRAPAAERHIAEGGAMHHVTRHVLGLGQGFPGARRFRQLLSVDVHKAADPLRVLDQAIELLAGR